VTGFQSFLDAREIWEVPLAASVVAGALLGGGDREDHFPSNDSAGEGKTRPNLEGDGGGLR